MRQNTPSLLPVSPSASALVAVLVLVLNCAGTASASEPRIPVSPMGALAAPAAATASAREAGLTASGGAAPVDAPPPSADGSWLWPVSGARVVVEPYRAPQHDYGAGHRGVDLQALPGTDVRAPASGVVAFSGVVADRPLLTIDHGDGLVTTFEPVVSDLRAGAEVAAGARIGRVSSGGHAARGSLHLGVRWHGGYVDPMLFFGAVARAVLLPCCAHARPG